MTTRPTSEGAANRLRRSGIAVSSLTFFLGLILQPAIGQLVDGTLKAPDKFLVCVALLTTLAVAIGMMALLWREEAHQLRLASLEDIVRSWAETTALTVEFIRRGPHGTAADPYAVVIDLVEKAQKEILILDHRIPKGAARFGPEIDIKRPGRKLYYDALDRAISVKHGGDRIRYRRVVQLADGPSKTWFAGANDDDLFASHCRNLVAIRNSDVQTPSSIKTSRVYVPNSTIVIIDQTSILMEVAINGPHGGASVQGDLVFHDNAGVLAGPLRQLFENIDSQAVLVEEVHDGAA